MAKLHFRAFSLLLLHAVAALAVPNGSPARPADGVLAAGVTAAPTASPEQFQTDLQKRLVGPVSTSVSIPLANSFTNDGNSSSVSPTSSEGSAMVMATGAFTGADGGIYGFTQMGSSIIVAGRTLSPGQVALIGNENVSDGPNGLVANGMTLPVTTVTMSAMDSTTAAATTTSSAGSSMGSTSAASASGSVIAAGSTLATVAASSSSSSGGSSSSAAAAAPTQQAGSALIAVAGGLLGLLFL